MKGSKNKENILEERQSRRQLFDVGQRLNKGNGYDIEEDQSKDEPANNQLSVELRRNFTAFFDLTRRSQYVIDTFFQSMSRSSGAADTIHSCGTLE